MIRAVIDTNIVVSGLLFGGIPYRVVRAAINRKFIHVTSLPLMTEIEKVIRSKKFGLTHKEADFLLNPFFDRASIVVPTLDINVISRCPADNRVLECAVEGKCKFIVTGDRRDLLSLKHYQHIEIIGARQFVAYL